MSYAQENPSFQDSADNKKIISPRFIDDVSSKSDKLQRKLERKSNKLLDALEKQEGKLQRKLSKSDSSRSAEVFANSKLLYQQVKNRVNGQASLSQYMPDLDTMTNSLKFLEGQSSFLKNTPELKGKLSDAVAKVKRLESEFQRADRIKEFVRERKDYLKRQLSQAGMLKQLKKFNKQSYYYSQQVSEYKSLLKDRKKAEQKALQILGKTKIFKDFMAKNGMLNRFFPVPTQSFSSAAPSSQAGFAALQTRSQVTSFIQQQTGVTSISAMSGLNKNIQDAQSQLDALRNKLNGMGKGGDLEMPDFKPNSQRTKSFFQRIEYGINFQSQKASNLFPATSDLGFSAGYKLNDNSTIGIGGSYKSGWGRGWKNIKLTNEGLSLRSFLEWKIKGSIWIAGGYEQNYRSAFKSFNELKDLSGWQQSGLLGLSKVVSLRSKVLKKAKVQLLWDFLSYRQAPQTQPLLFRIGYTL